MNAIGTWIGARLLEPSTWAGLALIGTGISNAVTNKDWAAAAQVVGGALATIISEGKYQPKKTT